MRTTYSKIKFLMHTFDYVIVNRETVTKTVHHKIPTTVGAFTTHFPEYLKGFEKYYNLNYSEWGGTLYDSDIKPEYMFNRPEYSYEVTYEVLDIELTEVGKKKVQFRYDLHKRNMEKYGAFLK